MQTVPDVLVVGAGVIGLAVGWRCRQQGLSVLVIDPAPGTGASRTAAGMLAPVTELHYGEQPLLQLTLASAARYPDFVAELEDVTGRGVGYRRTGTVVAAWDGADLAGLRDLAAFAAALGQPAEPLTGRELRGLVPGIAPGLPGGLLVADDHQVDNRRLHAALLEAVRCSGGHVATEAAARFHVLGDRIGGVTTTGGRTLTAGAVVLAAGAHSSRIAGLPDRARPRVHPVKGQTLRLRMAGGPPTILRGSVRGSPVYLVPRAPGAGGAAEVVIGASSEDAGFDITSRAGAVYELLRDAQCLLPAVSEAELVEISTALRPGSPDNAPLIGHSGIDRLILATGHYRNGILLTPITGDGVAATIVDGSPPPELLPFTPERCAPAEVR